MSVLALLSFSTMDAFISAVVVKADEKKERQVTTLAQSSLEMTNLFEQMDLGEIAVSHEQLYTPSSFASADLANIIKEADLLLANSEITQEQVDEYAKKLNEKLISLVPTGDTQELENILAQAGELKAENYTPESFELLQQAIEKTKTLLEDKADQATINTALEELSAAISSLVEVDSNQEIDKPEGVLPPVAPPVTQPEVTNPEISKPEVSAPEVAKPEIPKTETQKPETSEQLPETVEPNETPATTPDIQEEKPLPQAPNLREIEPQQVVQEETPQERRTFGTYSNPLLDESLLVDSLTESNLNGFELPLLASLESPNEAAILSESLKQLGLPFDEDGQAPDSFNNLQLPNYIYKQIFDVDLGEDYEELRNSGEEVALDELKIGDLLFWNTGSKEEKVAIYLGQGKYILAEENKDIQQNIVIEDEEEDESEEVAGVRIFTLYGYPLDEEDEFDLETIENPPELATRPKGDFQLNEYAQDLVKQYAARMDFRQAKVTENFIETIGEDARELGLKYDVFASVMIAQAILESGSGSSSLAIVPHYNLFGMKGSYQGSSTLLPTMEDDGSGNLFSIYSSFRSYPNYAASMQDYIELIRGNQAPSQEFYKGAWRSEAKNYLQATQFLTGKYATDTLYNVKLNSLIATYNLTRFDEPLMTEPGEIIPDGNHIPQTFRQQISEDLFDGVNRNFSGSYPVGQCTWYVFNRAAQLGKHFDNYMGNGGDWGKSAKRLGYETSSSAKVGYAMSFAPSVAGADATYGHVAFVEAITKDGVLISESNVLGLGKISYRVIPREVAESSGVSYIAPKDMADLMNR